MTFDEWWETLATPSMVGYDDSSQKTVARMAWNAATQHAQSEIHRLKMSFGSFADGAASSEGTYFGEDWALKLAAECEAYYHQHKQR